MTTNHTPAIPDAEPLAAAADLAAALREMIEVSVTTTVGAGEIRAAAELVRQATERLGVARRPRGQLSPLDDAATGRRVFNPVSGIASALAPPLILRREQDGVVGETTVGVAFEGPPGYVHGGMSALFMDQVLGDAAVVAGVWGMTAHLELDYRGPLPVGETLVCRGRVAETHERKTLIVGTIALASAPDVPLVEARGLFVLPRREKLAAYFGGVTDSSGTPRQLRTIGDASAVEGA